MNNNKMFNAKKREKVNNKIVCIIKEKKIKIMKRKNKMMNKKKQL
jgi:hypothetical protein